MKTIVIIALVIACTAVGPVRAHDHLEAGASSDTPGAALVFVNASDFGGQSGFVFNLGAGATNSPYAGWYYMDDLVFASLAATGDNGGPEPGHAGLGAHIQVQLLGVEGPKGATLGFWETSDDGFDSTNLTWSILVPFSGGTNRIDVSENDGSAGSDPYGHIHGRIYSVNRPGLYKTTWRFVDSSTNGPNKTAVNSPSLLFDLYFQADLTLGTLSTTTNGLALNFAAPSNVPDENPDAPPTSYTLESSPVLGPKAVWTQAAAPISGDDHLHQIALPSPATTLFWRLRAEGAGM